MQRHILLIEDDEGIRDEMGTFFSNREWNVTKAINGEEAHKLLQQKELHFDCLVLDLMMPIMNGISLLKKLKHDNISHPPVVVLSGYLVEDKAKTCYDLGAKCILKKPFLLEELLSITKAISNVVDDDLVRLTNTRK